MYSHLFLLNGYMGFASPATQQKKTSDNDKLKECSNNKYSCTHFIHAVKWLFAVG